MKPALIFLCVYGASATAIAAQPNASDGMNLVPHLLQSRPLPERTMFWRSGDSKAVRWKNWKLVRIHNRPFELYDLNDNPVEHTKQNLIRNRTEIANNLLNRLSDWEQQVEEK